MTLLETLQRCPLFKDFTETGLKIFASISQEKSVPLGAPLFAENMVGESLFIVQAGTVRVTQRGPDGQDRELGLLGPGEHLGALALLGRSVRQVSAVAATPVEVVEITHRDFVRLQPQKPQACLKLAVAIGTDVAGRVTDLREQLRTLAGKR